MDEKRVIDYFVVAGLPDEPEPLDEFTNEANLKANHKQDPIVDIAVIIRNLGEVPPPKYKCVEFTPTGFPADLNHGSIRSPEVYLCYRRGRDKPPLTDIGVLYEGKERVLAGCEIVHTTPHGRPANVNNSNTSRTYITYRRAEDTAACDTLAVTDICVILANKGEMPPHAFCQISKTLNKGMVGSDVYLCYKKSMAKADTIAYKTALLGRYPMVDYPNFPLPNDVPMFCLPLGASLECWPTKANHPQPVFSTFVLTGESYQKIYGAAITFYEEYNENKLTEAQRKQLGLDRPPPSGKPIPKKVHHNKSICILSKWPFFATFRKFLNYIYRISITGPHTVPIERHISHFLTEVPFPSLQRPRILVQLNDEAISLSQPEETPLPQSGASFTMMLKNLGPENCMNLLLHALIESKILIHSLRPAVLTSVAEAVANIIFPFHWQCPYIPLCPLGLSEVLSAPLPFIVGVDSRYFDLYDAPQEVLCVDLDTNTVSMIDEKKGTTTVNHKLLPKRPAKVLRNTLEKLFDKLCQEGSGSSTPVEASFGMPSIDHDFKQRRKELVMETAIQEAFLRFMACILKSYNNYLLPITAAPTLGSTEVSALFEVQAFQKSRDKAYHKFFNQLMKTQIFSRFIEERSFVSDKDASLAFFDECVEKVDEYKEDPKLIELEENSQSDRTVFVTPPEPVGLPEGVVYEYDGFPLLNPDLFLYKQKSSMIDRLKQTPCPNSPMTRRTKQEIRTAQKIAQRNVGKPGLWAKCLLGHCYSLWFIHLPAYVKSSHSKTKALKVAYEVLGKMQSAKLQPPDEICYRVLMQLCGLYHQPVLAVKVLFEMKRSGVHPNAITYGFYNKAVLESKWPSSDGNAYLLWNKLRNTVQAIAQFKRALRRQNLSLYSNSESDFDRISTDSFLDEPHQDKGAIVDGGIPSNKTAFVSDLVTVDGTANKEECTSTGGMSDRGYSSMTLDDAKRSSMIIGSQDSLDSKNVGKIVTKSSPIVTNDNKDGSSAGLLMTSQVSFDDGNGNISHSLNGSILDQEENRKRHKSAGDHNKVNDQDARERHKSSGETVTGFTRKSLDGATIGESSQENLCNVENDKTITEESNGEVDHLTNDKVPDDESNDNEVENTEEMNSTNCESNSNVFEAFDGNQLANTLPFSESTNSLNMSPSKTVRTPVTSNDPLGLFALGVEKDKSKPEKSSSNVDILAGLSTSNTSISGSDRGLFSGEKKVNVLIEVEPFASDKANESNTDSTLTPTKIDLSDEGSPNRHRPCTQSNSFSSSEASSPGSPVKEWAPLSNEKDSSNKLSKTNSLPHAKSSETALVPTKKGKNVGRSESFSNRLRFAASTFASKFSELKQSMAGTESSESNKGSTTSLPKAHEMEKHLYEEETMHKATSSDHLSKPEERADTGSLNDLLDGGKRHPRQYGKYTPYVPEFLDGWVSSGWVSSGLSALGLQGINLSLDSLKGGEKTTESTADYTGSAPAQSLLEKYIPMKDIDNGSKQGLGSNQSIPQTFFNVAMEVEMCSLSKCNTCTALLYDEDIMAGWSADDSNLNTTCQFCQAKLVPFLQIYIKDFRQSSKPVLITPSQSIESMQSIQSMPGYQAQQGTSVTTDKRVSTHSDSVNRSLTSLSSGDNGGHQCDSEESKSGVKLSASADARLLGDGLGSVKKEEQGGSTETSNVKDSGILIDTAQDEVDNNERNLVDLSTIDESVDTDNHTREPALIDLSPVPFSEIKSSIKNSDISLSNVTSPISGDSESTTSSSLPSSKGASKGSKDSGVGQMSQDGANGLSMGEKKSTDPDALSQKSTKSLGDDGTASMASSVGAESNQSRKVVMLEPISVAYLSPLVLRKEVENVLEQEGDMCLSKAEFVDEHPIIFWNLVWYLKRLEIDTHLTGFILTAKSTNKDYVPPKSWSTADSRHVLIRVMWDNIKMHDPEAGVPMYTKYNTLDSSSVNANVTMTEAQTFPISVMQKIVSYIMDNNVVEPIRLIMGERRKLRNKNKTRYRSIYRDILFLSITALGRGNIDQDAFDREYLLAFDDLSTKEQFRLKPYDKPQKPKVIWCRRLFGPLEL